MTPPRRNPCRSVRLYKKNRCGRFLTPEEYRRLGRVLDEAETQGGFLPSGVAAIRLLLLTGCRKERDHHAQVGRHRPHGGRDQDQGRQDRRAAHPADAGGGMGAGGHPGHRR